MADTALVDKLTTRILTTDSITANMISVGGFEFQNGQIYGGSDFGVGPGVKITSKDEERSFKAYKDANNYISMFYNSANDWGLKGVVGGNTVFQLGNPSGAGTFVGPFNFTKTQLVSSSDVTIGSSNYKQGFTLENNKISFNRAVSSICLLYTSATGFKIDRVETFDTYYRVYCRPEDFNEFEVNDQARIQTVSYTHLTSKKRI